jgi:hypothetical protein
MLPALPSPAKTSRPFPPAVRHDPEACIPPDLACDACRARQQRSDREWLERDEASRERCRLRDVEDRLFDATGIRAKDLAAVLRPLMAPLEKGCE